MIFLFKYKFLNISSICVISYCLSILKRRKKTLLILLQKPSISSFLLSFLLYHSFLLYIYPVKYKLNFVIFYNVVQNLKIYLLARVFLIIFFFLLTFFQLCISYRYMLYIIYYLIHNIL